MRADKTGGDRAERPVAIPEATIVLEDGTAVTLAQMHPSDDERLVRFHNGLSADTTRRRFFSIHPELTPEEIHRFTHVDHVDREAIVVSSEGDIVAVARFDRIGAGTDAEMAFVVADGWQRRGLGSALLAWLVTRARELGITRLVAETMSDNFGMLAVFRGAGLPISERAHYGSVEVAIEVGPPPRPD